MSTSGVTEDTRINLSAQTWCGLIGIVAASTATVVWGYSRIENRVSHLEEAFASLVEMRKEDIATRKEWREDMLAAINGAFNAARGLSK